MIASELFSNVDEMEVLSLLSDLVAIPSYDSEQNMVEYIAGRLEKIGVEYDVTKVSAARQNLTASVGKNDRSLIFNSHTDTVPPGDLRNWKYPPVKLTREGERLFGLGSCDAKGSLASMLRAFEILACNPSLLNGRLILQAVCCEETGARGTLAEVARGINADAAIIGEPTELIPRIGHKGALRLEVTVFGKAAHGSAPQEGVNAISRMARIIRSLDSLAEEIYTRSDPLFGNASLAVTRINGGQASNVIPDKCAITLDRRLIPGETLQDALDEISAVINQEKKSDPILSERLSGSFALPNVLIKSSIGIKPCKIQPEEAIAKVVKESIAQVTGANQELSGFSACCDMWCLTEGAGIPVVILGPGELSMAHKANESISVNDLCKAVRIYTAVALNWLNGNNGEHRQWT